MEHRNGGVVRHYGIVETVSGRLCTVRILQASACQACVSRNLCTISENKEKVVEVCTDGHTVTVGQNVCIEGSVRQGMKAVLLGYGMPLVVLVAVLCPVSVWFGELAGAFSALLSVGAYFILLHFFRGCLGRRFVFRISDCGL